MAVGNGCRDGVNGTIRIGHGQPFSLFRCYCPCAIGVFRSSRKGRVVRQIRNCQTGRSVNSLWNTVRAIAIRNNAFGQGAIQNIAAQRCPIHLNVQFLSAAIFPIDDFNRVQAVFQGVKAAIACFRAAVTDKFCDCFAANFQPEPIVAGNAEIMVAGLNLDIADDLDDKTICCCIGCSRRGVAVRFQELPDIVTAFIVDFRRGEGYIRTPCCNQGICRSKRILGAICVEYLTG